MQELELTLDQMLADPIVRQLMARDGVVEADLRGLAVRLEGRLTQAAPRRRLEEARSFAPESMDETP